MKEIKGQISMFEEPKTMYMWSIYAVSRRYDGGVIEFAVKAYTEKQARFLFHKLKDPHYQYMITGCYAII